MGALLLAACGSASTSASTTSTSTKTATQVTVPLPAGRLPSKIATMVCTPKAQRKIAKVLGVHAVVQDRRWVDHQYSCRYVYADGVMTLSVKELSSWPQTLAYFNGLKSTYGDTGSLGNLGQGAFQTTDGSVVVRKDWKVLLVDVSGLPASFGKPATSRGDVAYTVADLILGCWDGD